MRAVLTLSAAVAIGLLAPSAGSAATFKTNCATQSLQNRINAVPAGSVILVKGTCGPVSIDKNITLDGNPTATISGGGADRPVTISGSPTVKLVDLRITGGKISAQLANGGGIYHPGGLLVLRRTVLTGNVAESIGPIGPLAQGGGIYSTGGTIQLFSSSVRNNTARAIGGGGSSAYGGGIIHTGAGALLIDHSSVTGNRARSETASATTHANGGGIYDSGGKVTIRSSKVTGNVATATGTGAATGATARGGALVQSSASPLSITGSSVSGNSALSVLLGGVGVAQGGGLDVANATVTIKGTVLDGNAARATSSASATMWALGAAVSLQSPVASSIQGSKVTKSRAVATTGGTATASGAGFYLVGRPLVVRRSLVASNFADATGGSGSSTAEGGGLSLKSGANVQLVGSTVRGNRADSGGGISTSTGGGIASASSILRVRSSTLNANVAATSGQALGGGIYLASGGPHTVENSTFSGNRANGTTARGGAIDVDTTLAVTAATIARNSAKLGGGIYVEGGTTTLRATLLGLNTATMSGANCSQSVASAGRNLVASTLGCTFAATGTDKTGLAPKIGLLRANGGPTFTIALLAGSPALNAIPKAQCPFGRDQRGVRRPQPKTGRCDIGAYERKP